MAARWANTRGISAAPEASLMWGTMYVPYRTAYLSGMKQLSFVTVITVGELGTVLALTPALNARIHSSALQLFYAERTFLVVSRRIGLVIGDIFQQFAAKYLR